MSWNRGLSVCGMTTTTKRKTAPLHHEEGLPRTNKLKYVEREYNVVL